MLVDDEKLNLVMLKFILNNIFKNINVIITQSGLKGIELFNKFNLLNFDENSICMIVTDLNMPIMDGWKMSLEIKNIIVANNLKDIPIIAYSSIIYD